jgi:putative hydrolase of the HAD superfamily
LYGQQLIRLLMALELASLPIRARSLSKSATILKAIATFRRVREELREAGSGHPSLAEVQYTETARRIGCDAEDVERWVGEWILRRPLKYLRFGRKAGLEQFLTYLQGAGIAAGVLSDYPAADKLEALRLTSYFSVMVCTTDPDVNAFKPHPAGFLRACALWGLRPEEVLYVGDRPEVDATGAAAAGMPCAILTRKAASRRAAGTSPPHFVVPFYGSLQRALTRRR